MGLLSTPRRAEEPFVLGFIGGRTGPYERIAKNEERGATLAVEECNAAGGINGRPVEVRFADDAMKPEVGEKAAKELLAGGAHMLAGTISAETQLAINAIARDAGIPFISCSQSNRIGTTEYRGPYTFHEALTPYMTGHFITRWGFDVFGKRFASIIADYRWGHESYDSSMKVLEELGGVNAGVVAVRFGASVEEYEAVFPKILAMKADVLNVRNFGRDQVNFIKAAARVGLKKEIPILIGISESIFVDTIPLDDLVGLYWGTNFYWGLADKIPSAQKFVDAYRKRFDDDRPSGYCGYAYAGVKEALTALAETKFDGTSYEPMREFLEGRHYDHYKGAQWWRPCDHQSFQDFYLLRFKGPEESVDKHDIAEHMGTVSWDLSVERTCDELGYSGGASR